MMDSARVKWSQVESCKSKQVSNVMCSVVQCSTFIDCSARSLDRSHTTQSSQCQRGGKRYNSSCTRSTGTRSALIWFGMLKPPNVLAKLTFSWNRCTYLYNEYS